MTCSSRWFVLASQKEENQTGNKNSRKFKKAYNVMLQIIDKYYFEIDKY